MNKSGWLLIVLVTIFSASVAIAEEITPLQFVTEYVRELAAIDHLRDRAASELTKTDENPLMGCIRNMTSLQLELQTHIAILKRMQLQPPFESAISNIIEFDEMRLESYGRYIEACTTMAEAPRPNIDYSAIAAELPKETARLDYIDQALFEAMPLFLATLIDSRVDAQNHVNHLVITKAERQKLIEDIILDFGEKLTKKNQNYIVGSAKVAHKFLLSDFESADEPW